MDLVIREEIKDYEVENPLANCIERFNEGRRVCLRREGSIGDHFEMKQLINIFFTRLS